MLVLISSIWAQRTKWTLTRALIGGAQPMEGWWAAPVAQPHKREVRTSGTTYEVHRRHCSPPQNPNPIREGGCSGGKRHHAIAGAPATLQRPLHRAATTPPYPRRCCTATWMRYRLRPMFFPNRK